MSCEVPALLCQSLTGKQLCDYESAGVVLKRRKLLIISPPPPHTHTHTYTYTHLQVPMSPSYPIRMRCMGIGLPTLFCKNTYSLPLFLFSRF